MMTLLLTPFTTPRQCLLFAVLSVAVMIVLLWFYPNYAPSLLGFDSFEYIEFHTHRSALYPAFLDLFGGDTLYNYQPKLDLIATTQIIIFLLALAAMMVALAHARLPISVLVVFLVALTSNYHLHAYHKTLLAESLGLSLLCLLIGCLALWFHKRSYWWLASAMLVASISFGLRPNMVAMPIGVAIVGLFHIINTRHWRKPLIALVVPFVLVAGVESAYFYAHHPSRSHELLQRHMFGKAALVLAIHEEGQSDQFYQGEFARLKPFMARFGGSFRANRDHYWANGDGCVWLNMHAEYEGALYWNFNPIPDIDWGWRVFSAYPLTTAQVIAQHYINFFCMSIPILRDQPLASGEFLQVQSLPPPSPLKRFFLQLIAYAFIALGIAFFISKFYYGIRWGIMLLTALRRLVPWRGMAFLSSRFTPPPLTPLESLGSTCIMLAFGYNLFISIFSVSITRFLIISYPLMVLGILLVAVVFLKEITHTTPHLPAS